MIYCTTHVVSPLGSYVGMAQKQDGGSNQCIGILYLLHHNSVHRIQINEVQGEMWRFTYFTYRISPLA